jgi:hypothetical protein
MWGGRYNPIIPVDDAENAQRLVELFRVDVICPLGESEQVRSFPKTFPHLINPFHHDDMFLKGSGGEESRAVLLDVHNRLSHIHDSPVVAQMRDHRIWLYDWQDDDPLADIFLIQFGRYPQVDQTGIDYRGFVNEVFEPETHKLSPDSAIPVEVLKHASIPYICRQGLQRHYSLRPGWDYPGFYVGSASNFDDVTNFWNLRAADIPLFFVDPDKDKENRFKEIIPAWQSELPRQVLHPQDKDRVGVWGRTEVVEDPPKIFGDRPLTVLRISDYSWGGGVRPPMMYFGEAHALGTVSRTAGAPRVSFQLSDKPFDSDSWFHTQHLVASVSCGLGLHGDEQFTLEPPFVPELNEFLARTMHFQYDHLRVEPERLGIVIKATSTDTFINAVAAADLFERIFNLAGYSSKLSNGGLITRQLISRLQGVQGGRVFKIPGVRRLLRTHGPLASFTKAGALQLIGAKDGDNPGALFSEHEDLYIEARPMGTKLTPQAVFSYLVEKGLFRIGRDLTCPACRLTSWIPLDTLKQQVICDLCGNQYEATRQLVEDYWSYRRSGVLGLERHAQGAVPVALTLQQLDANLSSFDSHSYLPSVDLQLKSRPEEKCEIDFVWMLNSSDGERAVVILGECKDRHSGIDSRDIENLRRVADAIPRKRFETYILLSKLGPFSPEEAALASTLNGEHQQRVIMLTARELEPYHFFERTKKEFSIDEYGHSPAQLANATALIYFGAKRAHQAA